MPCDEWALLEARSPPRIVIEPDLSAGARTERLATLEALHARLVAESPPGSDLVVRAAREAGRRSPRAAAGDLRRRDRAPRRTSSARRLFHARGAHAGHPGGSARCLSLAAAGSPRDPRRRGIPRGEPGGCSREASAPTPRGKRPLSGVRVLLADDDADLRDAVQSLLERNGAAVTAVASAAAALNAFERSRPDVLLSVLGMPGESGYALMRRIAALDSTLPAAAMTAFGEIADVARALEAGFTMQLGKPVDAAALVAAIAALAATRRAGDVGS